MYTILSLCVYASSEEAMALTADPSSSPTESHTTILQSCLTGDIGYALKHLYELSGGMISIHHSTLSIIALQCVVDLSDLLVKSETATDLTLPIPDSPNECSFLEEITLQFTSVLSSNNYPIEVLQSYLYSCPIQGRAYAGALLSHRICVTDGEVCHLGT